MRDNELTGNMAYYIKITRKLSHLKDDRAMRPIYGGPENFRESLNTPTATFTEVFNGLLFRLRGFGNYTYSERLNLLKLPSRTETPPF